MPTADPGIGGTGSLGSEWGDSGKEGLRASVFRFSKDSISEARRVE